MLLRDILRAAAEARAWESPLPDSAKFCSSFNVACLLVFIALMFWEDFYLHRVFFIYHPCAITYKHLDSFGNENKNMLPISIIISIIPSMSEQNIAYYDLPIIVLICQ